MWYSDVDNAFRQKPSTGLALLTLFLAFALEFFPWHARLMAVKPVFPLLVLVYWVLHHPRLINYAAGIVVGVIIDLSNQTPLGFNALACTVVVFLTNKCYGRFVLLGAVAQMLHVAFILSAGQLTLYFLGALEADKPLPAIGWRFFLPSLLAGLTWLMLPPLIRRLRRLVRGGANAR